MVGLRQCTCTYNVSKKQWKKQKTKSKLLCSARIMFLSIWVYFVSGVFWVIISFDETNRRNFLFEDFKLSSWNPHINYYRIVIDWLIHIGYQMNKVSFFFLVVCFVFVMLLHSFNYYIITNQLVYWIKNSEHSIATSFENCNLWNVYGVWFPYSFFISFNWICI